MSGLTVIVSILFWRLYYEGGFSWNSHPGNQFSWHPLLMSLTIILLGYGAIMYRITPCVQRYWVKAVFSKLIQLDSLQSCFIISLCFSILFEGGLKFIVWFFLVCPVAHGSCTHLTPRTQFFKHKLCLLLVKHKNKTINVWRELTDTCYA